MTSKKVISPIFEVGLQNRNICPVNAQKGAAATINQ